MGNGWSKENIEEHKMMGVDYKDFWRQLFSTVGDGTGTTDMAAAADEYFILPGSSSVYVVEKIKILVEDSGDLPNDEFASTGGALANGIKFELIQGDVTNKNVINSYLGGVLIKQNSDFTLLGEVTYSIDIAGLSTLLCEIDCVKEFGFPLFVDGEHNYGLRIETQDDLSGLDRMLVMVSGIQKDVRVI